MTIEQTLIFLIGTIVAMLAVYAVVIYLWHREDKPVSGHWEIGCRIRSSRDPHSFLPGVWMPSVTFSDGSREWERIA